MKYIVNKKAVLNHQPMNLHFDKNVLKNHNYDLTNELNASNTSNKKINALPGAPAAKN